jgi:hypothetical protein
MKDQFGMAHISKSFLLSKKVSSCVTRGVERGEIRVALCRGGHMCVNS